MPVDMPVGTPAPPEENAFDRFFATAHREKRPITWRMLGRLQSHLLKLLGQVLREEYAARDVRLDALELRTRTLVERVATLEERGDAGVWAAEKSYTRFAGTTHYGGYWIAQRDTQRGEQPGRSTAWRLAVHRGKPGRDGKDLR